jgi:hypothetical protein
MGFGGGRDESGSGESPSHMRECEQKGTPTTLSVEAHSMPLNHRLETRSSWLLHGMR